MSDPIDRALVEGVLIDAFPGARVHTSSSLGRRRVYGVVIYEFSLKITTPETPEMKKPTTMAFRRRVEKQSKKGNSSFLALEKQWTFESTDPDGLKKEVRWAKSYILGIVAALSQAFHEP